MRTMMNLVWNHDGDSCLRIYDRLCQGRLCVEGVSEQKPEDDEESAMWRQREEHPKQ